MQNQKRNSAKKMGRKINVIIVKLIFDVNKNSKIENEKVGK